MKKLIDELRDARPFVIADILERALDYWHPFEASMRRAAARGASYVTLSPEDRTPAARAVAAAVAEKAKAEGFKVTRIVQAPDAMASALGAAEVVCWKVAW